MLTAEDEALVEEVVRALVGRKRQEVEQVPGLWLALAERCAWPPWEWSRKDGYGRGVAVLREHPEHGEVWCLTVEAQRWNQQQRVVRRRHHELVEGWGPWWAAYPRLEVKRVVGESQELLARVGCGEVTRRRLRAQGVRRPDEERQGCELVLGDLWVRRGDRVLFRENRVFAEIDLALLMRARGM